MPTPAGNPTCHRTPVPPRYSGPPGAGRRAEFVARSACAGLPAASSRRFERGQAIAVAPGRRRCLREPTGALSGRVSKKAEAQAVADANSEIFRPDPWCLHAGGTTIGGLFAARARIDAAEVALIEGERRVTFAALNERVNRLAHVLAAAGIRRGDRVGMLARNSAAWVELELAAAKLGAIVAAQNWRLAAPELVHCIRLAEPRAMLVAEDYAGVLAGLDVDGAAHDHARRRLRGAPRARRYPRTAGGRRAGGSSRDPLHQRHDRSAQGRRGQPPRVRRARAGVHHRARPRPGRGVRRLGAVLPHGLDRPCARRACSRATR